MNGVVQPLQLQGPASGLLPHPAGVSTLLSIAHSVLAEHRTAGETPAQQPDHCQPTLVAKEALILWDIYLAPGDEQCRSAFLSRTADWSLALSKVQQLPREGRLSAARPDVSFAAGQGMPEEGDA